ncbi:HAMP domain-containing histidine kinase [Staphylococcus simiae]|uniref:two-component system sensor histidine kinase SaeS n=1 Tax=Staphylococcus simiae TaxID=308354 RepID=UPI001A963BBC|nr:HAMP domain-containing sensor histidine kinase [Staphylococcus simiae]MBO1199994.1 HAMP domain-containing histidine kinase [Staphylococcus simiae]MBO1200758.1 HAMP domain-containing histidine kinase [Staphylococcus simiae]MBO1204530.1 HAMP domain-containing histidine kinase [Staphylococcus simiae]MBO1210558.1 HAMP domain-containing histidine kinase [Staphylococcus simiae]MBO1229094.1 HAMP domain-containing histidine kinase [Staphylococcus simiae]
MLSIRSQIVISVISTVLLTTIILAIAYKLMWFNGHMTVTLTLTTIITSCLTLLICSVFINPLIQKIKHFNIKTKQFANGNVITNDHDFTSPKEIYELNQSFNKMADEITQQMNQIKSEQQEKNELIQNLAHDLKTPLASIISYSEGLRDGIISKDDEIKESYDILIKQANRLSSLFDAMTHIITLNTGKTYPTELLQLDQLLVSILQPYEQRIRQENRTLEVNFCSKVDAFYQYRIPLERILTNLLDNAIKFSSIGSRIDISIKDNKELHTIDIAIKDEGIGILPELQHRIFERTFRVENSRNIETGGSGLGLYIAQELAQQIHAQITVNSDIDKGTTMIVSLKKLHMHS